jgi:hypothetical protein
MKTNDKISKLLEESLLLTAKLVIFAKELENLNKKSLSLKILESGIKLSTYLFDAKSAVLDFDINYKLEKSMSSAKDIVYWLLQCSRSKNYPSSPELTKISQTMVNNLEKEIYTLKNKCVN